VRKGIILKQRLSGKAPVRAASLAVGTTALALAAFVPGFASGADYSYPAPAPTAPSATTSTTPTVYIKDGKQGLRFVAPKTVTGGEDLKVINQTNPRQVGPHTFSLVTKSSLPKTPKARQLCFTKGHICKAIARWQGARGNGPPTINPAEAGAAGWSTMGSLTEKGDSWFTGNKPGTSIVQQVTADVSAGPTTIYFLCAVHPFMQGSITVLQGG
jgi:hypothetical protein